MASFFYCNPESIMIKLEKLSSRTRRALTEDGLPAQPSVNTNPGPSSRGHNLPSDINRDLKVECGQGLEWVDSLSQLNRQLIEDSDMRVEIDEPTQKPIRIICKRDPEFNEPVNTTTLTVSDGSEEFLAQDSDDIMDMIDRGELEVVNTENNTFAPMDKWDLTFSAEEFVGYARNNDLTQDELIQAAEDMIYSADFFPRRQWKNKHTPYVTMLANKIKAGQMTKKSLFNALNRKPKISEGDKRNARPVLIGTLNYRAKTVLEREQLALKGAKTELVLTKDSELKKELQGEIIATNTRILNGKRYFKMLQPSKELSIPEHLSVEEMKYLWDLYYDYEETKNGEVKLPKSKFVKMLRAKLKDVENAEERVQAAVKNLYK